MARKGKYEEWLEDDKLLLLQGWARDGLTNEQIANNIGISTVTLYDWQNKYPSFSNALKKGKEVVDIEVENALLKRAMGYTYEEKTIENGKVTKIVTKQVAPDTTALIFWLKNRKPQVWRDKQEVQSNVEVENLNVLADILK